MIKRFFSLYDTKALIIFTGVLFLFSLTSPNINGLWENISSIILCVLLVFGMNYTVLHENWTWLKTGLKTDISDSRLTNSGREVKQARLGNSDRLFIPVKDGYCYRDNNYGLESNKIDATLVNSKKAYDILHKNKEKS